MAIRRTNSCIMHPLATGVAAALLLSAPCAMAATTWVVNNCSQYSATGTLRYAATNAASGDTIDMSGLTCSTISLTTGSIIVPQSSLTINGPGQAKLTITGKGASTPDRIFSHTGTGGTLKIKNLSVAYGVTSTGNLIAPKKGGCIYSAADVYLDHVGVNNCTSTGTGFDAGTGGGIFTQGSLTLKYSTAKANTASGGHGLVSPRGGAIWSNSGVTLLSSTVNGNSAYRGGGLFLGGGNLYVTASTVSGNSAKMRGGAIVVSGSAGSGITKIINSTISGNSAASAGGVFTNSSKVYLESSTIAFNTAAVGFYDTSPTHYYAAGVALDGLTGAQSVSMHSTLIANNAWGDPPNSELDLSVIDPATSQVAFRGNNNLMVAAVAPIPPDTIHACPLLGPLRDNGGPTHTHAMLSHSPGMDQGNNTIPLTYDQRGYSFPRISGRIADMGAYEVQQNDTVFNAGFDGCP